MAERKLVTPERREEDVAEATLRPQHLADFVGQEQAREKFEGVHRRGAGPARGAGPCAVRRPARAWKTTLAQIVARELGVNFRATSGPIIAKKPATSPRFSPISKSATCSSLTRCTGSTRRSRKFLSGDGGFSARPDDRRRAGRAFGENRHCEIHPGRCHHPRGPAYNPLRDRFGIPIRLNFYSEAELEQIVNRGARVLGISITADGANEIARRARGTPRIAGRLLRRVRDFAAVGNAPTIDRKVADTALAALEVDPAGLDAMDRRYLTTIAMNYGGGPVGVETLAAALSEPRDAIEDVIEPYLIQCGFLQRTPRGRLITGHAFRHLGLAEPARDPAQFGLFSEGGDT